MNEILGTFTNELFFPLLVFGASNILVWMFNKVKPLNLLRVRNTIWRCPCEKSIQEKYGRFLVDMVMTLLVITIIVGFISIAASKLFDISVENFQKIMKYSSVATYVLFLVLYNAKTPFELMFGAKEGSRKKERLLLNIPVILLIAMCWNMFSEYNVIITIIVVCLYVAFEVLGFYLLDGKVENKYKFACIYASNYLKYKDVVVKSIREEKKWLIFSYNELGREHVARILKSTIERVEYYNEH